MRRLLTTAALLLAVCWVGGAPLVAQTAKERVTLRLSSYSTGEHAGFAYGLDRGMYAEEGIDLIILEGGGSASTVQSVGGGADRFGYADATAMAGLVSRGLPVTMIANYSQTSPVAILSFADKAINTPRDLEGKKVALTGGELAQQRFPTLLRINGVDQTKIAQVLLPSRTRQTAFMSGAVDAMGGSLTAEMAAIERETGRGLSSLRYADVGVNALGHGLVIRTGQAGDRSLNCRMLEATSRAWLAATKDPDGAVDALHKLFPYTNRGARSVTRKQWLDSARLLHTPRSEGKPPGYMVKEDWDDLLGLAKDSSGLEPLKPTSAYYTDEFFDCP